MRAEQLEQRSIPRSCLFLHTYSWVRWWTWTDLALIAETGSSVAHCPTPFARHSQILENFGEYLRAGVTIGLGTDTGPHNLVEEMRKAAILARIAARDIEGMTTADLFHAATVGGTTALLRDDLGRLAPGKKAYVMVVDLNVPQMVPARDPLRSFIYHAADRAVCDVFIDGRQGVADGKVMTLDQAGAGRRLAAAPHAGNGAAARLPWPQRRADFAAESAAARLIHAGNA
ncbi:MAG: amidohydrolase family protein [Xanthobacteraceae bacterium]